MISYSKVRLISLPFLLALFLSSVIVKAQLCWNNDIVVNPQSDVVPFCDDVLVTYSITNTSCSDPTSFDISIRVFPGQFEYLDYSDMPGATIQTVAGQTILDWQTPDVLLDETFVFELTLTPVATNGGPQNIRFLTKDDDEQLFVDEVRQVLTSQATLVSGPADVSDLITNEILPDASESCEPDEFQQLFVEGGINFDLGTESAPVTYCIVNPVTSPISRLDFAPGAYARIEAHTTLVIEDMEIKSCEGMWRGFIVEKDATLVLKNCTISGAQYAIQAARGSTIECFGNIFEDNYVGIYVEPGLTTIGEGGPDPVDPDATSVKLLNFYGNMFRGTGTMLPAFNGQTPLPGQSPYAGILINDVTSFRVPAGNFGGSLFRHEFYDMSNGIIANRSDFSVDRAIFENLQSDGVSNYSFEGYGIYTSGQAFGRYTGYGAQSTVAFNKCHTAIYSSTGSIVVREANIENVQVGVHVRRNLGRMTQIHDNRISAEEFGVLVDHSVPISGSSGRIEDNTIFVNGSPESGACVAIHNLPVDSRWEVINNGMGVYEGRYGVNIVSGDRTLARKNSILLLQANEDDRFGLNLAGTRNCEVGCNVIDGDGSSSAWKLEIGVNLESSSGNIINCNDISSFRYDLAAAGMSDGTDLKGNVLGSGWIGLLLGRWPSDGNAWIGEQRHRGNLWVSSYDEDGAVHLGDFLQAQGSLFFVDPSVDPNLLPTDIDGPAGWFNSEDDNGDTYECDQSSCPDGIGVADLVPFWTKFDSLLATDALNNSTYNKPLTWTGQFHMLRRLLDWQGQWTPPQTAQAFLSQHASSNMRTFAETLDSLGNTVLPDSSDRITIESQLDEAISSFDTLMVVDSLLHIDPMNASYLVTLQDMSDTSVNILRNLHTTFFTHDTTVASTVDELKSEVASIQSSDAWQVDLRDALYQVLQYITGDTADMLRLNEIANQCPDQSGDAVFIARARLKELGYYSNYDDRNLCGGEEIPPITTPVIKDDELTVWPNPATNYIHVKSEHDIKQIGLYTTAGVLVQQWKVSGFSQKIDLQSDHVSGLYFLDIELQTGEHQHSNIVIQKK